MEPYRSRPSAHRRSAHATSYCALPVRRCRTTVSIRGDAVEAAVIDRLALPHHERKEAQAEPLRA